MRGKIALSNDHKVVNTIRELIKGWDENKRVLEYDHEIINTMYGSACLKCQLENEDLDNKDSCEVRSL